MTASCRAICAAKPISSGPRPRKTQNPAGWRSSQCFAMAADSAPSWRSTMVTMASASPSRSPSAYTSPRLFQSNNADAAGFARCRNIRSASAPQRSRPLLAEIRLTACSTHLSVHVPIGARVAPAQVPVDHDPRQVMRKHAVGPRLHERQAPQPAEQLLALAISEDAAQKTRRGQPRVRRTIERQPMARTRHAGQEALHQPPHHVGSRAQLEWPDSRLRPPLREHVHQK